MAALAPVASAEAEYEALTTEEKVAAVAAMKSAGKKKSGKPTGGDKKCATHKKFGDKAYSCGGGGCPMKDKVMPRPAAATEAEAEEPTEEELSALVNDD